MPPHSLTDLAGLSVSAEDFLAAVLETVAQPIWVVDPDGVIRFANPAAIAALGYDSADELLGRHSHETIHYKHPDGTPYPAVDCPMLLPRATGETVASDLDWFFRRDGSMFPVSYVSVPIEMPEGRGAVVAFTDIEDRLRAERGAARARCGAGGAARPRCGGSRRWWPAGRRRRTCSPRSRREVGHVAAACRWCVVWRYDPEDGDRDRRVERAAASVPGRHALAARRTTASPSRCSRPAALRGSTTSPSSPARSPTPAASTGIHRAPARRSSSTATSGA